MGAIRAEFGQCVFHDNGELNRAALRTIIFEDEEQRQKLNRITHPEIYKEMIWEAVKCAAAGHQYIVMDLPLLFEAGVMVAYMHKIIVVTCEEDLQLQRLMEQRHLSERDSKLMIGAQMNMDKKWLPWCSGSHGTVCDREQWITPRHTRAGSEDPRKLVQILLPLESEVTAGSRHWRSLWYCLPRLQKGDAVWRDSGVENRNLDSPVLRLNPGALELPLNFRSDKSLTFCFSFSPAFQNCQIASYALSRSGCSRPHVIG